MMDEREISRKTINRCDNYFETVGCAVLLTMYELRSQVKQDTVFWWLIIRK